MQTVLCMSCGNPTVPAQKNGPRGPWTAWECHSGCLKPGTNYKLTTKAPQQTAPQVQRQAPPQNDAMLKAMQSIATSLHTIATHITLSKDPLEQQTEGF